jgi:hypothetical protein
VEAAHPGNKSNGSPHPSEEKEEHRKSLRRLVAAVAAGSVCWLPLGVGPAAAIPQMRPQRFAAARTVGKSQVPGSVALATTSRRVSRPLFLWGRTLLPVSLVLLPGLAGLFLCGASGHTRRCRQPTDETPGRRGCRARLPTNTSERPQTRQRRHGLPETWVEGGGCCPCVGGATPQPILRQGFSQTHASRVGYPDNLCEPPFVWSNCFEI